PAAGGGASMMFIPEVDDEVLVSFIDGDPDQPIIVGSVYNANNPPPVPLPAEKDVSVIRLEKSDVTLGDGDLSISDGDLRIDVGNVSVANGSLSVDEGNLALTEGGLDLNDGHVLVGSGYFRMCPPQAGLSFHTYGGDATSATTGDIYFSAEATLV